jgi:hypothetical protein
VVRYWGDEMPESAKRVIARAEDQKKEEFEARKQETAGTNEQRG